MRPTLFISDLHLDGARPQIVEVFFRFLEVEARAADALYILGDLFDFWVGDDQLDHDPLSRRVAQQLSILAASGVKCFFMRGNRDFLVGARLADAAGLTMLDDPTEIILEGRRVLLMHGDTLCTDDIAYQAFRRQARDPAWQREILALPYTQRVALARSIRERSDTEKASKPEDIMDVSAQTVAQVFRDSGVELLIHGHTHRPAQHRLVVDGVERVRRVLGDWIESGPVAAGIV